MIPGREAEFEDAFRQAQRIISTMNRYRSHDLRRCVEAAHRYIPLVNGDKLKDHNLLFTSEIMWSPDLLVPLEQYVVGGPDNVRGYRSTEKLFDRAVFGSVEWIINAPFVADVPAFGNRTWGEIIQFSMFYDVASGYLNSALAPTERKAENYNSVGVAFSFNNPKVFSSKLTIAAPVGSGPRPEESGWEPKYWLDVNVFF